MEPETPEMLVCCDITGRLVPERDTVVIDDRRVCAEGKRILLERLRNLEMAAEAPAGTEEPALWRRSAAASIDFALATALMFAAFVTLGVVHGIIGGERMASAAAMAAKNVALLMTVAQFLYAVLMTGWRGQTLGKMACRIAVVRDDASAIDLRTALLRTLAHRGPELVAGALILAASLGSVDEQIAFGAEGFALLYLVLSTIVAVAAGDRQRAIHDKIAGTRVVAKARA